MNPIGVHQTRVKPLSQMPQRRFAGPRQWTNVSRKCFSHAAFELWLVIKLAINGSNLTRFTGGSPSTTNPQSASSSPTGLVLDPHRWHLQLSGVNAVNRTMVFGPEGMHNQIGHFATSGCTLPGIIEAWSRMDHTMTWPHSFKFRCPISEGL